jgi:Rieske Fe-S protein
MNAIGITRSEYRRVEQAPEPEHDDATERQFWRVDEDEGVAPTPRDACRMRMRVILGLVVAVVLCGGAVMFLALWDGGPSNDRAGVVAVDLSDLRTGSAKAVAVSLPDMKPRRARIFLARGHSHDVRAFLGVSTHLGCRLLLPGDPGYGQGFTRSSRRYLFEDPCGGSVYALNGDCTGGPCPRALDRYLVEVRDDTVEVDLNRLIAGPSRGA